MQPALTTGVVLAAVGAYRLVSLFVAFLGMKGAIMGIQVGQH